MAVLQYSVPNGLGINYSGQDCYSCLWCFRHQGTKGQGSLGCTGIMSACCIIDRSLDPNAYELCHASYVADRVPCTLSLAVSGIYPTPCVGPVLRQLSGPSSGLGRFNISPPGDRLPVVWQMPVMPCVQWHSRLFVLGQAMLMALASIRPRSDPLAARETAVAELPTLL